MATIGNPQMREMGSAAYVGAERQRETNLCLPLSCFAHEPNRLPESEPVRAVIDWLLSKRPTRHSFMSPDEEPFVLACHWLRVRVLAYHLAEDGKSAYLSVDTHPNDPDFVCHDDGASSVPPPPLATRTVIFRAHHYRRLDSRREDEQVSRTLQTFSGSRTLLWQRLEQDLKEVYDAQQTPDGGNRRSCISNSSSSSSNNNEGVGADKDRRRSSSSSSSTTAVEVERAMREKQAAREQRQRQEDADLAMALKMADEDAAKDFWAREEHVALVVMARQAEKEEAADRAMARALAIAFAQEQKEAEEDRQRMMSPPPMASFDCDVRTA